MAETSTLGSQNFNVSLSAFKDDAPCTIVYNKDYRFYALDVYEMLNSFPYFILKIDGGLANAETLAELCSVTDFSIEIKPMKEDIPNQQFSAFLGVHSFLRDNNSNLFVYEGWLTKQKSFRLPRTRYLGNGFTSAMETLGIFGDKKINCQNNVSDDFFQINQTDAQMTLSLCQYAASSPYWSIGLHGVDLDTTPYKPDPDVNISGSNMTNAQTLFFTVNLIFDFWKKNGSKEGFAFKSSGGEFVKALGTPDAYMISNSLQESSDNSLILSECISSGMKCYGLFETPGFFPLNISTVLSDTLFKVPGISKWVIGSIYHYYNILTGEGMPPPVRTLVQFIGLPESLSQKA